MASVANLSQIIISPLVLKQTLLNNLVEGDEKAVFVPKENVFEIITDQDLIENRHLGYPQS